MKKNITNIIFDLDGTIINSGPDLFDALNHVLEQKELNPIKRNILGNLVGGGAEAMIKKGFDFLNYKYSNDEIPELVKTFLTYYFDHCAEKSFLYKDVQESLIKLKILGYKIGLCTNKKQYLTEKILTEYKIDNLFDIILGLLEPTNGKYYLETREKISNYKNNISFLEQKPSFFFDNIISNILMREINWVNDVDKEMHLFKIYDKHSI